MDKVFCTGASGFVGSNLIPEMVKRNYDVYALERYVTGRYIQGEKRNVKTLEGNLNDHDRIREIISDLKPEYIVHLAAISAQGYSYDHPFEVIETNFRATVNIAEACRRYNPDLKQFLYAGTAEEYGNQHSSPIVESAEPRPVSPYAVSKVASDKYLGYMLKAYGFPITVLRAFNTYGRTDNFNFVVERIISQMLKNGEVKLGNPEPIRDLMYVSDHVDAYLACIGNERAIGETFNFCTGTGVSIRELAETIGDLLDYRGEIVWETIPPRPQDIKTLIGDYSKARRVLSWKPEITLAEGLKRTIDKLQDKWFVSPMDTTGLG